MKKETNSSWINIHDDELMVKLGIRPKPLPEKDSSVWTKTLKEKKALRSYRCEHKENMHFGSIPKRSNPVQAKIIIQLVKNNKFPHTTYSKVCNMNKIDDILNSFTYITKNGKTVNVVAKYKYNGKEYSPNERPFWAV